MRDINKIRESIKLTLKNSHQFLKDAKHLKKKGSIGHATSLAILGYEEAHKAYLLTFFLPVFDTLVDDDYRTKLKSDIRKHEMKHRTAFAFRKGINLISETSSAALIETILRTPLKNLKPATLFVGGTKLNDLKNIGFYIDPFSAKEIIGPMRVTDKDFSQVIHLLETHLKAMDTIVDFYSDETIAFPEDIIQKAGDLQSIIAQLVNKEIEFEVGIRKLEELGEYGILVAEMLVAFEKQKRK